MTNNYIRVGKDPIEELIMFDDRQPHQVQVALDEAETRQLSRRQPDGTLPRVAVWRPLALINLRRIGHSAKMLPGLNGQMTEEQFDL